MIHEQSGNAKTCVWLCLEMNLHHPMRSQRIVKIRSGRKNLKPSPTCQHLQTLLGTLWWKTPSPVVATDFFLRLVLGTNDHTSFRINLWHYAIAQGILRNQPSKLKHQPIEFSGWSFQRSKPTSSLQNRLSQGKPEPHAWQGSPRHRMGSNCRIFPFRNTSKHLQASLNIRDHNIALHAQREWKSTGVYIFLIDRIWI